MTKNGTALGDFLDVSMLRAGDVILTAKEGFEPELIQTVTGGNYSHAVLVIAPCLWFESEDEGVGNTGVQLDHCEFDAGHLYQMFSLTAFKNFTVLRHPSLA